MSHNNTNEEEIIRLTIDYIDSQHYENIYLMWTSDIRDIQHQKIKHECYKISKILKSTDDFENLDVKLPIEPFNKY